MSQQPPDNAASMDDVWFWKPPVTMTGVSGNLDFINFAKLTNNGVMPLAPFSVSSPS
jgi:hypothetical protein